VGNMGIFNPTGFSLRFVDGLSCILEVPYDDDGTLLLDATY